MNCRRVQQRLSNYLEGLLSRREAVAVAAHLHDCSACRRLRDVFVAIGADLRAVPDPFPPAGVERRVADRWLAEQRAAVRTGPSALPREDARFLTRTPRPSLRQSPSRALRHWRSGGLAAAILLAVLGLLLTPRHPDRGREHGVQVASSDGWPQERETGESGTVMLAHPSAGRAGTATGAMRRTPAPTPCPPPPTSREGELRKRLFLSSPSPRIGGGGQGVGAGVSSTASLVSPPRPALRRAHRVRAEDAKATPARDDLAALNGLPPRRTPWGTAPPADQGDPIEAQVRREIPVRDDFITIPFPRLASTADRPIAQAVESYKREAAIVDPRLSHEVTCAFKATALSDLCDQLRSETGIQLAAGPSVADEKVTVFCEKLPLREVMRQLSRPFGYTWLRTRRELGVGGWELGKNDPGRTPTPNSQPPTPAYRYELVQDLRSQLLEEELRNRDRDAALLALEKDLEQYRPFLDLSPDEALARAKSASPAEKPLLEDLAGTAWGPLHLYFRLSSQELAALRAGQELKFSEAPRPGEKPRPEMGSEVLPPEIARGVLQSVRFLRLIKTDEGWEYSPGDSPPAALPPAAIPEARAWVLLGLGPSDLSQFTFKATDGVFTIGPDGGVRLHASFGGGGRSRSSAHQKTDNAAANAALAHDPALGARVTVVPVAGSPWAVVNEGPDRRLPGDKKVNSAEVLEALHQATGIPIVADFYTRLFKRDAVSVRNQPVFGALNQLGDAMRTRWHKEAGWLQLRSLTFFDDRRKEIPNRLLSHWANVRRQHGWLSLDDLVEIAQLPDAQLDAAEMAEGVREWWGLAEWDLACSSTVRPHLRYLARLTPEQRRETMSATGLPFTGMSLAQQQQFMAFGLGDAPLRSLDELAGATLRVEYTQPGQFQWGEPGWSGYYTRWVIPLGSGPQDHRALRPPVTARTRQETLAAVRRVDPQLREALLQAVDRADPRAPQALETFEEQQIFPTQRNLTFVYIPGATNARSILVLSAADGFSGRCNYRLR